MGDKLVNESKNGNYDNWKVASLTEQQKEEIQQLEQQLGYVLIAYSDSENAGEVSGILGSL